ncbi:MAG: hypothetical protein ACI33P_04100 [Lysinibacillus sp.]
MDWTSNSSKAKSEQRDPFFKGKMAEQHHDCTERLLGLFAGEDERAYYLKK